MGIDLGTSSVKAVLMDRGGKVAAVASHGYEVEIPESGFAQQRPEIWWEQTKRVIREVIKKSGCLFRSDKSSRILRPDAWSGGFG